MYTQKVRPLVVLFFLGPLLAQELTHRSQVMGDVRSYRVHLPANYAASAKRYPVIYWLHAYEAGDEERSAQLAAYSTKHDVVIVDSGPAEASGNYPLYLPELADHIDHTLRTIADRGHRGVSGYGAAGLLALWQASKAPDLIGSASAVSPARSASIGPRGFEVDTVLEDLRASYDSVRTQLLNSDGGLIAALDFHLKAFADPLPKAKRFDHADPYPNFSIWGWNVVSNRRQPGYTLLQDVSSRGFRSEVREWLPGGASLPEVKLTIESAPLFEPRSSHKVTYIRLTDRKTRRVLQRADAQGRLSFDLDGAAWEVGIGIEPLLTITQYEVLDAAWPNAGRPVKIRLTFLNKGAVPVRPTLLRWASPSAGVKFAQPVAHLPGLAPGESTPITMTFTAATALAGSARINAGEAGIDVPVFAAASAATDFKILDESDHDGHASPGERFAISLGENRAELITNDSCVDTSVRVVEAGWRFSQAAIRANCPPGHVVHALARTASRDAAVEFPVWYALPN